jgi:hypothetical protein
MVGRVLMILFAVVGLFDYLLIYATSEHRRE